MGLVLVAYEENGEKTYPLQPGTNLLGSSVDNQVQIQSQNVRPHHLNIEYGHDSLSIYSAAPDIVFHFQNQPCKQATVKPGESFTVDSVTLYCQVIHASERTELALSSNPKSSQPASPPRLSDMQVSGFVKQKIVDKSPFTIGRHESCDLSLPHPMVSGFHARIEKSGGTATIVDLHSTNGTFVADASIRRASISPGETILIMPYLILYTGDRVNVYTFQQESRLIGWQVQVAAGSKKILDQVSLSCSSGELVGLIGPSGSGKTTLMKCLSGQMMPTAGRIQLNGLELFSHFDAFKHNIGFVPQDDILHRELTVLQALMYAAKLRLPADMTEKERKIRVMETLIELELEEQERLPIHRLSGGQRKRMNIAMELLTQPGILFLDEPTSGLDPALDEKLMQLFKKLSGSGRITILTTHLLENASLFSRIALVHSGRLIFCGTPDHATQFFQVPALSALYSRLKTKPAEEWQQTFQKTPVSLEETAEIKNSVLPSRRKETAAPHSRPEAPALQVRQTAILSRRYLDIILRDPKNTGLLLLQAPLIAGFILIATTNLSSRLFMMALAAIWFGCNNSAREICKELAVYRRERMVFLGIAPYLFSKVFVLISLILIQCGVLALLTPYDFLDAYWPLVLSGFAGISLGLLLSSIVDSPDKAIALVPIILIPQVLFSGIFGEMRGHQRVMGEVMISKWSYNLLKKEFSLPSLKEKEQLEDQIDASQEILQESQARATKIQKQLDGILDDMSENTDPVELDTLRFDAEERMKELKREQSKMSDARESLDEAEQKIRANAKLFVWIDRPESKTSDWIALLCFNIVFLSAAAFQLKRRDSLLRLL